MNALILCGMPAAGKTVTAQAIAKKLGIECIGGGDVLKEMAGERGYKVTGEGWWDTPEGIKFLRERESNADFDKEADRRMIAKIEKGNVVVTSYTMPWLSQKGVKCWLEASPETRAKRMAVRDGISEERAQEVVKIRDRENFELYRKMYKIALGGDLKPFNIVLDVNNITIDEAAEELIRQSRKFGSF
ncbi:MAG: cytidylate kinase family protein [Candidatus Micrarchaeota archaeon]|nr:cytidylate kinase family protein [Candidatus Micrarchaeota archaeon]